MIMNKTAVVILNWNGIKLLKRFLKRVVDNTDKADIIIADNNSDDGSTEWVNAEYPAIRIIRFSENLGYAAGYNRAIFQLSEYDNIIMLNSDAAPEKDWIAPLLNTLEEKSVVGVQPKILSEVNHAEFEYAGACGGFIDRNGYPYCRGRIFSTVESDSGQYDTPIEIFWASGAALAVKREAFINVGGFDDNFFAHMEEIDLCWRLRLNGGKIVCEPESIVYHLGGGTLDNASSQKTYLNFRNNLLMLFKNLPHKKGKTWIITRRRLYDTLAFISYVIQGKFGHAGAVLRAHRDYRKMKNQYGIFPKRNLLTDIRRRNIIIDYFLKRKKTFRDIQVR